MAYLSFIWSFCWSLYPWFAILTALLKLTISNSSTFLPAVIRHMLVMYLQLSPDCKLWVGMKLRRQSRCFTCMRTLHLSAASIYCISDRAPKRLSNSFINQGLQVQLFLQPIKNSVYGLRSFAAQGVKKHKNAAEGQGQQSSWDNKMMGNYEEELKKKIIICSKGGSTNNVQIFQKL